MEPSTQIAPELTSGSRILIEMLKRNGVKHLFGYPGGTIMPVYDALVGSGLKHYLCRHEQGAALAADAYGRVTRKAGVCMATSGPGATNLVTGIADANMDRAPVVAVAGQVATTRMHKESHQYLDLVNLFQPITKYSVQIRAPEITPEVVIGAGVI